MTLASRQLVTDLTWPRIQGERDQVSFYLMTPQMESQTLCQAEAGCHFVLCIEVGLFSIWLLRRNYAQDDSIAVVTSVANMQSIV